MLVKDFGLLGEWDGATVRHLVRFIQATGQVPEPSHAWLPCEVCGAAVDDPEAAEPCERTVVDPNG